MLQDEPDKNLSLIWDRIQYYYDKMDIENRYSHMKMTMFNTKSQPKLRGKAAEVKDMGPVLLEVCHDLLNSEVSIHQRIVAILEGPTFT